MNFVFQSTFSYNTRVLICDVLTSFGGKIYTKYFKNKTLKWAVNLNHFKTPTSGSLGNELYRFLEKENFSLMPKHESHDVFHVLSEYGTTKEEEIALQYFLFGNGKKSLYLFLSLIIGGLIFPEFISLFKEAYFRGKKAFPFYKIQYEKILHYPTKKLQRIFNIENRFRPI